MADEARYIVRSSPSEGFAGVFRAGRRWDVGGTEIELTSDKQDPPAQEGGGVLRVGQDTFAALSGDPRISIVPKGESKPVVESLKARVAELEQDLAAARERADGLEKGLAETRKSYEDALTRAQKEVESAKASNSDALAASIATELEATKEELQATKSELEALKHKKHGK
jgi:hypothetical protein